MNEHPDDRAARIKSEKWARMVIGKFVADHADELRLLIQTYSDAEAAKRLEDLRERFWSMPQGGV